jgi:hypothetical protein
MRIARPGNGIAGAKTPLAPTNEGRNADGVPGMHGIPQARAAVELEIAAERGTVLIIALLALPG